MSPMADEHPVVEMRLVITTEDYQRLVRFYCDVLGSEPAASFSNDGGRAILLEMGNATLELFDEAQAQAIDRIEAGQRLSGRMRLALQVPDLDAAMQRLQAHGILPLHSPVDTPWGDRNVRFQDPDGMQITLFESGRAPDSASQG